MLGLRRDFICELADREDDRIAPQKNHLVKARFFHGSKMREVKQSKKVFNLANISKNGKPLAGGCVNFFLLAIYRWIGF